MDSIIVWESYKNELDSFRFEISKIHYDPKPLNFKKIVKSTSVGMYSMDQVIGVDHGSIDKDLFVLPNNTEYLNKKDFFKLTPPPSLPDLPLKPDIPDNLQYLFESEKNAQDINFFSVLKNFVQNFNSESDATRENINLFKSLVRDTTLVSNKVAEELEEKKNDFFQLYETKKKELDKILNEKKDKKIILTLKQYDEFYKLPKFLISNLDIFVANESKVLLIEFEYPSFDKKEIVIGQTSGYKNKYATTKQKILIVEKCLFSLIIRIMYLAALTVEDEDIEGIAVNVKHSWHDSATGKLEHGIAASIFANVREVKELDLSKLDPVACFKNLKGLNTISHKTISSLRPIFQYNKEDNRIVKTVDVDSTIEESQNLASMEWEDFEHLVAQLFEWEFAKDGSEVKVTRASRDRGVDAILYDPDPIKGGKYVIQAKRYTKTVDVSAVRDLYGTVMNEGANRGILITTAGYGPDAYDFAKDKPISLIDGPNLLAMLQRHGKKYRINIAEARQNLL